MTNPQPGNKENFSRLFSHTHTHTHQLTLVYPHIELLDSVSFFVDCYSFIDLLRLYRHVVTLWTKYNDASVFVRGVI